MVKYVIYGKIIIDDIRTSDGRLVQDVLGGGGPQGAFGARLWSDSVGLLSRSGRDINAGHTETIEGLGIDVSGWAKYPDILTLVWHMMRKASGRVIQSLRIVLWGRKIGSDCYPNR
jgi:hypothetical protein